MKAMTALLACVLALLLSAAPGPALAQAAGYLCVTDLGTRIVLDRVSRHWRQQNVPGGERYIFRRPTDAERATYARPQWVVLKPGQSQPIALCDKEFAETGAITCDGLEMFNFSRTTLRFLSVYALGYWLEPQPNAAEGAPPAMALGRCTEF